MHYFHTHFNVYPNPQGEVHTRDNQAAANITSGKLGVVEYVDQKASGREDVQQQIHADKAGTGSYIRQTEQHAESHHKVQAVLKVGPFVAPIQGLAIAHPKDSVVGKVSNVPEQQQGSVVVVDQDVFVGF